MSVAASKGGPPADGEDPLLVFVHVPKTGGTSLQGVFQQNDRPVFNIRSPDQARAFLDLPQSRAEGAAADRMQGSAGCKQP